MPDDQERHYNINKLNVLFAFASILLLGALIFMLADDYSREWKHYQSEFREMEIKKTRKKYSTDVKELQENSAYQTLLKKLNAAQEKLSGKSREIQSVQGGIGKIQAYYDLVNQRYRFAKAQYDAARYSYEEARSHQSPKVAAAKKELDQVAAETEQYRLEAGKADAELSRERQRLFSLQEEIKSFEKEEKTYTKQVDLLERKLKKIDPKSMSLANKAANALRNLPILDFANPSSKINQIVVPDIKDSVNFMEVPKVDRCTTCHLGIDNPEYQDAPQPFRTHPNLELFVAHNSAHPLEEFGCTSCHGGRGRGTDFTSAAHRPSSDAQAKEWTKKYHWHDFRYWETPMYPKQYVEAGCFKCHSNETLIKGAEKLNLGLNLIEKAGCYGCHVIEKYKDWPKVGPDLRHLAAKSSPNWVYLWIENPKSLRHNTWMPSFFGQSNNRDPVSKKRGEQEIHAIVAYLFKNSSAYPMSAMTFAGDAKHGEELVASLGCFGCHQTAPEKNNKPVTRDLLRREHGPNLIGLGAKTTRQWIYNWLKDPQAYHPESRMPNLRLSDQEASDIAAYLTADSNKVSYNEIPAVDEMVVNGIVEEFLKKNMAIDEVKSQMTKMSVDDKLVYAGRQLIHQYGCFGCHNIAGFESEKPIGTELTEEGSKSVERLDFGFIEIEHSNHAWFTQKLKDPRIFDQNRVKAPDEKLRMPNFYFTDEETEAIVTALMGFIKDKPEASKLTPRTAHNEFIEEGRKIVREFNCQGCHIIEGEGGAIQPKVVDWLVQYQGKGEGEATAMSNSFSPPNLVGEGKKVHAEWLFEFIHQPAVIRPWLKVRMPAYAFNAAQINALVKYFNYLDNQQFPFIAHTEVVMNQEERKAAEMLFSKDYFGCASCHIVGQELPSGSPDSWAPNFALAKTRLKPDWILEWLRNPQDLLPGTKMPTYFDPHSFDSSGPDDILGGDENKQIKALRDYILTLSDAGTTLAPKTEAAAEIKP